MVFNRSNPRNVDSFTLVAQGDDPRLDLYVPFVSPDKVDTSANSLMVQEDTAEARIWRHDFDTETWEIVATVNDPEGESSGIVDASSFLGSGFWFLDVQAHGTFVEQETAADGTLYKRESGQLMVLYLPGS